VDISPVIFPVADPVPSGVGQVSKTRTGAHSGREAVVSNENGVTPKKMKKEGSSKSLSSPFVLDRKSAGASGVVPPLSLSQ